MLAKLSTELKAGDAVVVTMMAVRANGQTTGIWSGDGWRRSVMTAIPRLHSVTRARGAKLLLVGDYPIFGKRRSLRQNVPTLSASATSTPISYEESTTTNLWLDTYMAEYAMAQPTGEVSFSNVVHDRFCQDPTVHPTAVCSPDLWAGAQVTRMYYDDDHLNDRGSMYLWPWLCALLEGEGVID